MTRLGASISPELSLSKGEKIGFHSEPDCIRHLAAQSGVTHAILRYKEVWAGAGEKEEERTAQREGGQAGHAVRPQTKESASRVESKGCSHAQVAKDELSTLFCSPISGPGVRTSGTRPC